MTRGKRGAGVGPRLSVLDVVILLVIGYAIAAALINEALRERPRRGGHLVAVDQEVNEGGTRERDTAR